MKKVIICFYNLTEILFISSNAFRGQFKIKNKSFTKMKDEILNQNLPSVKEDKKNLREDILNVYSDYRIAFNEKA